MAQQTRGSDEESTELEQPQTEEESKEEHQQTEESQEEHPLKKKTIHKVRGCCACCTFCVVVFLIFTTVFCVSWWAHYCISYAIDNKKNLVPVCPVV